MKNSKYLGIDLGKSKSGIAVSDQLGLIAKPYDIYKHINLGSQRDLANYVAQLIQKLEIDEIIVGYPLNVDYTKNQKTEEVDRFITRLQNRIDLPIHRVNEYGSSQKANQHINKMYNFKKKIKTKDDAIAAAFILQSFLDER